jgi:hypothetical protein
MSTQIDHAQIQQPIVSWLIPTTLLRHRWWKRLIEFLEDDFPPGLSECIILGTQDLNFARKAREIGQTIVDSFALTDADIQQKWKNVRFIEKYDPTFNLAICRNILLAEAKGEVVIHRDADTALLRYGLTRHAIKQLAQSRLGLLSFPSLQNGVHFKPGKDLTVRQDLRYPDILLTNTANGMTTVLLRSIEKLVGGRNEALPYWGEHTALCTKLANAGFLCGYTNDGYWLAANDEESDISLTDDNRNSRALLERRVTIAMLNDFYNIKSHDVFWGAQRKRYKVIDESRDAVVNDLITKRSAQFNTEQRLSQDLHRYAFKPWECLSHQQSSIYIEQAKEIAAPFFQSLEKRLREHGLLLPI